MCVCDHVHVKSMLDVQCPILQADNEAVTVWMCKSRHYIHASLPMLSRGQEEPSWKALLHGTHIMHVVYWVWLWITMSLFRLDRDEHWIQLKNWLRIWEHTSQEMEAYFPKRWKHTSQEDESKFLKKIGAYSPKGWEHISQCGSPPISAPHKRTK